MSGGQLQWLVDTSRGVDLQRLDSSIAIVVHPEAFDDLKHASVAVKPASLAFQQDTQVFLILCSGPRRHVCLGGFVVTEQERRGDTLELRIRRALLTTTVDCEQLKLPLPSHTHLKKTATVATACHLTMKHTRELVRATFIQIPQAALEPKPLTELQPQQHKADTFKLLTTRESFQRPQRDRAVEAETRALWERLLAAVRRVEAFTARLGKFVFSLPPSVQQRGSHKQRDDLPDEDNFAQILQLVRVNMRALSQQWPWLPDGSTAPTSAPKLGSNQLRKHIHTKTLQRARQCFRPRAGSDNFTAILLGDSRMYQLYVAILRVLTSDAEFDNRDSDLFPGIGVQSVCGDMLLQRSGDGTQYREVRRFEAEGITITFHYSSRGPWDMYTEQTLKAALQAPPDVLLVSPCSLDVCLPETNSESADDALQSYSHKLLQLSATLREFQDTPTRVLCCVWPVFPACFRDFRPTTLLPAQVPRVVMQTQLNARVLETFFRAVDPESLHLRLVQFDFSQPDGSIRFQAYLPDFVHLKPTYAFQTLEQMLAHFQVEGDARQQQETMLLPITPTPSSALAYLKSSKEEIEVVQVQVDDFATVQSRLLSPTSRPCSTPGVWTPIGSQPATPTPSPNLLRTPTPSVTADPFEPVSSPTLSQIDAPSKQGLLVRKLGPQQNEFFVPIKRLLLEFQPIYHCVSVQQPAAEEHLETSASSREGQRSESKKRPSFDQQESARRKQRL